MTDEPDLETEYRDRRSAFRAMLASKHFDRTAYIQTVLRLMAIKDEIAPTALNRLLTEGDGQPPES